MFPKLNTQASDQANELGASSAGELGSRGTEIATMISRKTTALVQVVFVLAAAMGLSQDKVFFQVQGTVLDGSGAPVSEAEVRLSDGRYRVSLRTDREGRFSFSDVPVTVATLTVQSSGFSPVEQRWDAHAQGSNPIEITLVPVTHAERITVTATAPSSA